MQNTAITIKKLEDYSDILTPSQAAEILQISEQKIYQLIRTKDLKSRKIGRLYRINKADLVDYMQM